MHVGGDRSNRVVGVALLRLAGAHVACEGLLDVTTAVLELSTRRVEDHKSDITPTQHT